MTIFDAKNEPRVRKLAQALLYSMNFPENAPLDIILNRTEYGSNLDSMIDWIASKDCNIENPKVAFLELKNALVKECSLFSRYPQ